MGKYFWLALGVLLGIGISAAVVAAIIDMLIPWDKICPILAPAQRLAEAGSGLIAELEAWLTRAESFLHSGDSSEASEEARTGLGGILDRAGNIVGDVRDTAVDIVTAPLRELIDLAQDTLNSIQESVDAALDVIATVEELGCE